MCLDAPPGVDALSGCSVTFLVLFIFTETRSTSFVPAGGDGPGSVARATLRHSLRPEEQLWKQAAAHDIGWKAVGLRFLALQQRGRRSHPCPGLNCGGPFTVASLLLPNVLPSKSTWSDPMKGKQSGRLRWCCWLFSTQCLVKQYLRQGALL